MIFRKDELLVRQLTDTDAWSLLKWLTDPHVLEFYEGQQSSGGPSGMESSGDPMLRKVWLQEGEIPSGTRDV